jgi:hypothetical protein
MYRATAAVLAIVGLTARVSVGFEPVECCRPAPPCGCEPAPVACCEPACPPVSTVVPAKAAAPTPTPPPTPAPAKETAPSPPIPPQTLPEPAPPTQEETSPPPAEAVPEPTEPIVEPQPPAEAPPTQTPPTETPPAEPAPAPAEETEAPAENKEPPATPPNVEDIFGPTSFNDTLGEPGGWASEVSRRWSDTSGGLLATARVAGATGEHVVLLDDVGNTHTAPYSLLSDDDLGFLRRQIDARRTQLAQRAADETLLATQGR